MKNIIVIMVTLALCLTNAFARLGESELQIEQRYGKWIPPVAGSGISAMKMYRRSGMTIGVVYIEGRSEAEYFQKDDNSDFSNHEIELLMSANSGGYEWKLVNDGTLVFGSKNWMRDNDGAICTNKNKRVMIISARYRQLLKEDAKRSEDQKLSGF